MKLVFIYGLPGVGKLTVAKELSIITGYKLFHNQCSLKLKIDYLAEAEFRPDEHRGLNLTT